MFDLTPPGWPVAAAAFAAMVAAAGWATPAGHRHRRIVFPAALALAALVRWNWPLGGVPIATLAMAGVDTPIAMSARLFGSPFLVVLMAVAGVALSDLLARDRLVIASLALLVVAPIGGHLAGATVDRVTTIDVALVQGGGPQNTRADVCQNLGVFTRHMEASRTIDRDVDLVLWPEDVVHPVPDGTTSARCDLLGRTTALEELQDLAVALDATLVTGWFERAEDGTANLNYSLVIDRHGEPGDRFEKVRLVPFGEYVPFRSFVENFSDELPARDVRAGTEPAVLDTDLGPLGVAISWEVFFDSRARDAIGNGGQVLLNPTNGSSYWLTIVQSQQVASSRLRALETDRWVLQVAPTGFSAVVSPDGTVRDRTGVSEQAVLYDTIELRTGRTPAVVLGVWPVLLASLAVVGLAHRGSASAHLRDRARALRSRSTT